MAMWLSWREKMKRKHRIIDCVVSTFAVFVSCLEKVPDKTSKNRQESLLQLSQTEDLKVAWFNLSANFHSYSANPNRGFFG